MTIALLGAVVLGATVLSQSTALFTLGQLDTFTTLFAFVALAQAWNIQAGFTGQVSLGASAFVGIGAYTAGLVLLHTDVGYVTALVLAMLVGVVLAAVLAPPLLRLRGDYFAVGTLAAALAIQAWIINWDFAGGSTGISLPLDQIPSPVAVYQISCLVGGLALATACAVSRSSFGNRLRAVRDSESAAIGLGVSAFRHRLAALLISGALTGLTGGLVALQQVSFEPMGMLGINWTVNALLMTVVGGMGTVLGPVVGAVVVYYFLTRQLESYQTLSVVVEGLLLVAIVRFAPQGIWPLITRLLSWCLARAGDSGSSPRREGPS
ncbi:branched-chain amino acid ABC transporter permease [Nocardioides hungaricus]